jgi:hypothetical protein
MRIAYFKIDFFILLKGNKLNLRINFRFVYIGVGSNGSATDKKMMKIRKIFLLILVNFTIVVFWQSKNAILSKGKLFLKAKLEFALKDNLQHNVINNKSIIVKDSIMAIKIAETILFSIYGKLNIINQKPYEIYSDKKYWIIAGKLPKKHKGGTFLIIIDAQNSEIIKLTNGKWKEENYQIKNLL